VAKFDRITSNPNILNGQPTIRGMRLSVRRVVEALAVYPNWDDLRREYPELEAEDIRQALEFAARNLDESVQPLARSRPAVIHDRLADAGRLGGDSRVRNRHESH
jgi:uncharacterized protein (DUF433 family)